ncbi:hypothetical protein MCOR27_000573 [Pyricularia oryzae]|uniref:Short chain dehydrogenase n=5 Tax=Pyricularia TaxID=48558 RepID=A0ABQ8NN87_PYRGI|nr:short chain dehydrogenase [Pyricularia oryzae 70-15]ELQ40897.1 short chain dehydrogenase [Pyricularia oryzae Y34]KAH8847218.1 hypothetical protein MCOR01_000659 [Pyricularia oryzae]KAI6299717.1 hypothetical protein MCOR33_004418 [Pyricularia grisea]EHA51967.1 short chain dehydrogenase [Pyricularia oryzae 70-15]KAH9428578.1 hypothetical protein MCOR02_011127 [Pyricularia oryzae]
MSPSTIILITGANQGIGYASTKVIASSSDKYHVIVTGRTLEKAEKAVEQLKAEGGLKGSISALQLDQTDVASVERAAAAVDKEFGRLDVLVNNGAMGWQWHGDIQSQMYEYFVDIMATNVAGPFSVSRTFRPLLKKSSDPRSIYVSSGMGSHEFIQQNPMAAKSYGESGIPYPVTKAALNMVAELEAIVHGDEVKTKVFLFCPGLVVSNLRGPSEEMRQMGGNAGDPAVSGQTLLTIIEGKRDADLGRGTVHKDGVYAW